jgi:hypothetical protein
MLAIGACSGASSSAPKLFPATLYLGVEDTGARYAAPIAVGGTSPMAYSIEDASIATATAEDQQVEVGALRVGSTSLVVRNDFGQSSASLTVTTYGASERLAGAQAWQTFNCASCHDMGPDVTPSGIARRTDAQIAAAVGSGVNPDGGDVSIGKSQHSFAVQPPVGIVAFLRSLPARSVPTAGQ